MSRNEILSTIESQIKDRHPLPELFFNPISFTDMSLAFKQSVELVGGECLLSSSQEESERIVREKFSECERTVHNFDNSKMSSMSLNEFTIPHDADPLELLVADGKFAVAENGAIWVSEESVHQRSMFFLTQHLVIRINKRSIVQTMHDAYQKIDLSSAWGCFISGPSKTADIEQSLVIGAHGACSLLVILEDN